MFDFLGGLGGGITNLLPSFGGMISGAGGLLGKATDMFTGFLGDNKPQTPITMPNIQKKGGPTNCIPCKEVSVHTKIAPLDLAAAIILEPS